MVKEAVEHLGGTGSYADIKREIVSRYGEVNDSTMTCQIIICSVNHRSRVHYPENKKPRSAVAQYDFLFSTGRGRVETYDPATHGAWEIWRDEHGKLGVRCEGGSQLTRVVDDPEVAPEDFAFPLESHLRDFIALNLSVVKPGGARLTLYEDADGRDGLEYPTGVGPIDILARDHGGGFVVFELKLSRGPDYAVGQILRYMGWVTRHLALGAPVKGVIVAAEITDKLKYAVSLVPSVSMFEYSVVFDLREVGLDLGAPAV
jgi:hypothetical protein